MYFKINNSSLDICPDIINSNVSQLFYEACKYKRENEFNFIMSNSELMVGFISYAEPLNSLLAVMDNKFNVIFGLKTDAYITGCNISRDSQIITFITASGPGECSDSIFAVDTVNKKILFKIQTPVHCKYMKSCFVFDDFIEYEFDDFAIKIDFNGNDINPKETQNKMLKSKCVSPYHWNYEASLLIDSLNDEFLHEVELEIEIRLNAATSNPNMSKYQLANTYKKLGLCYINHNMKEKALYCFNKALELYPKIAVKRLIANLKK